MGWAQNEGDGRRWCILSTSSGKTLPLAAALVACGIEAWTPRRTIKRPAPRQARRFVMGQRRIMTEVDIPIIPGFVFVRSAHIADLLRLAALPDGPVQAFSILHVGDRIPLVGDRQVSGLREAEAEAAVAIQIEREADSREEERRARALRLGTERAKRKALRQEIKVFAEGEAVMVEGAPAFAGMVGTVVMSNGTSAKVHFGGAWVWNVEAWQISPVAVHVENIAA